MHRILLPCAAISAALPGAECRTLSGWPCRQTRSQRTPAPARLCSCSRGWRHINVHQGPIYMSCTCARSRYHSAYVAQSLPVLMTYVSLCISQRLFTCCRKAVNNIWIAICDIINRFLHPVIYIPRCFPLTASSLLCSKPYDFQFHSSSTIRFEIRKIIRIAARDKGRIYLTPLKASKSQVYSALTSPSSKLRRHWFIPSIFLVKARENIS